MKKYCTLILYVWSSIVTKFQENIIMNEWMRRFQMNQSVCAGVRNGFLRPYNREWIGRDSRLPFSKQKKIIIKNNNSLGTRTKWKNPIQNHCTRLTVCQSIGPVNANTALPSRNDDFLHQISYALQIPSLCGLSRALWREREYALIGHS